MFLRMIALGYLVLLTGAATKAAERWGPPRDLEFCSARDGTVQRYVELLPEPFDATKETPLLIVLHGHGSDRWQYVRQDRGECRGARDVALKHGMNRFQDSIRRWYGGTKQEQADAYRRRSPEFAAEKFTMPIALTTGGMDTLVPPHSVLRLAASLQKGNPAVLLLHRETGGHATDYEDTVEAYEFVVQRVLAGDKGR